MMRKDDLICVVFDLNVFTPFIKISEISTTSKDSNFKGLYLMSQHMYYLPNDIFKYFVNITELKIMTDQPALVKLPEQEFSHLKNVKKVHITNQKIYKLEANTFQNASSVKILLMPGNRIKKIDANAFKGLQNCMILSVSNNRIKSIKEGTFQFLSNIVSIDLSKNLITKISANIFEGSRPTMVDISYNSLITVPFIVVKNVIETEAEIAFFHWKFNACPSTTKNLKAIFNKNGNKKSKLSLEGIEDVLTECQIKIPRACAQKCSCSKNPTESAIIAANDEYDDYNNDDDDEYQDEMIKSAQDLFPGNQTACSLVNSTTLPNLSQENNMNSMTLNSIISLVNEEVRLLEEHFKNLSEVIDKVEGFLTGFANPEGSDGAAGGSGKVENGDGESTDKGDGDYFLKTGQTKNPDKTEPVEQIAPAYDFDNLKPLLEAGDENSDDNEEGMKYTMAKIFFTRPYKTTFWTR